MSDMSADMFSQPGAEGTGGTHEAPEAPWTLEPLTLNPSPARPSPPCPSDHLRAWLAAAPGPWRIGQVAMVRAEESARTARTEAGGADGVADESRYLLLHEDDAAGEADAATDSAARARAALVPLLLESGASTVLSAPASASTPAPVLLREWLRWDAAGAFRPLRGAPNLRPGWILGPLSAMQVVEALRLIYPGAVADWALHEAGALRVTPYEESAARQTGRFSVVRKLGDERLADMLRECCGGAPSADGTPNSGCLRIPIWAPHTPRPPTAKSRPEIPLLCAEACNYFISKAREKILGRLD
ncbi:hypothetical protein DB346_00125 [Verrucomicrobia bacterium LW23]|nr:hypothetical protein DB346_00125 [Verrucomicrobia bacterium LW23]